jgi:type IV pilus assembly protein PilE
MRTPQNVARDHGFTLVELLIVIAIIAVLAASAVPSFVDYIRRGRITEAVAQLSDYRVRMEQYFLDNRRYDDGAGSCGALAPVATPADSFSVVCTAAARIPSPTSRRCCAILRRRFACRGER